MVNMSAIAGLETRRIARGTKCRVDVWSCVTAYDKRQQSTHNLKGVGYDSHGHELLAVISAVHHERIGEALDDGTLGLSKAFDSEAAGRVGDVAGCTGLDVVPTEQWNKSANDHLQQDVPTDLVGYMAPSPPLPNDPRYPCKTKNALPAEQS